jgi:cytochrome b pre-mRNA-processing protein 3
MRRVVVALAVLIAAAAWLMIWSWHQGAEDRALAALSPSERGAVYSREMAAFRALCTASIGQEELGEHCRGRARFILKFPECDSQCQHFARGLLPGPER